MTTTKESVKATVGARYGGIAERLLQQQAQGLTLEIQPAAGTGASCCGPATNRQYRRSWRQPASPAIACWSTH